MDNIITATFGATREIKLRPRYRYDYGQYLRIVGADVPDVYEVHFGDAGLRVLSDGGLVAIPDELFEAGQDITAWLYVHTTADDGETVYRLTIPIIDRPKPVDYEPTPTEAGLVEQAIELLNREIQDIEEAHDNAVAAQTAARAAESAEEDASWAASAAALDAENASQSAAAAADSATAAGVSRDAADAAAGIARDVLESIPADYSDLAALVDTLTEYTSEAAQVSGSTITIEDAAPLPLDRLIVTLAPLQSGSGTPAPDNVRPIAGWTAVNVMLGSTDVPVCTVELPGTVYAGTLDVLTGVLTVTHKAFTATSANAADSTGKVFRIANQSDAVTVSGTVANILCDRFSVYSLGGLRGDSVANGICQNQTQFYVKRAGCTTLAATSAWLAENPVTVVYTLNTPLVYQLTPQQVVTLLGKNVIWADAGEVALTYRRDKIKALEDSMIEPGADGNTLVFASREG